MRFIWFYWLHWRPTLWDDMTPDEDALLDVHSEYVRRLNGEGRIVLAGAVEQPVIGFVFFYADSADEAEAVMRADPLFHARIVEMTVHKFNAGFVGSVPSS